MLDRGLPARRDRRRPNYVQPYEGGLPDGHTSWDRFNADPDLLNEMIGIVSCADQRVTKAPTPASGCQRAGPVQALALRDPQVETDKYTEVKYVNRPKIGTEGPVLCRGLARRSRRQGSGQDVRGLLRDRSAKEVRAANEAQSGSGGGRAAGAMTCPTTTKRFRSDWHVGIDPGRSGACIALAPDGYAEVLWSWRTMTTDRSSSGSPKSHQRDRGPVSPDAVPHALRALLLSGSWP